MKTEPQRMLVASRGVAALRIIRWAREAGMETVVLLHELDAESAWPEAADFSTFESRSQGARWPSAAGSVARAHDAGCDLIHPGWGALARDPDIVQALAMSSIAWVGAGAAQLELAEHRLRTRQLAEEHGIPVVPSSVPLVDRGEVDAWIARFGLPVRVCGVDRRQPRIVLTEPGGHQAEVEALLEQGAVVVERMVVAAREIEVPVVGGVDGTVVALAERETSVRQETNGGRGPRGAVGSRVFVESPAPGLSERQRHELAAIATIFARGIGWTGLGSVRFLLPPDGRLYLLHLRPGLLPWHATSELIHGLDLVDTQLRVALGEPLLWDARDLEVEGHALSVVLLAEGDGVIEALSHGIATGQDTARLDSLGPGDAVEDGEIIGVLSVRGPTRQAAIVRAKVALDKMVIEGVDSNLEALRRLFDDRGLWEGPVDRDRAVQVLLGEAPVAVPKPTTVR